MAITGSDLLSKYEEYKKKKKSNTVEKTSEEEKAPSKERITGASLLEKYEARNRYNSVETSEADHTYIETVKEFQEAAKNASLNPDQSSAGWQKYLDDIEKRKAAEQKAIEEETFWEKIGRYLSNTTSDTTLPMANLNQAINDVRNDTSYRKPNDDWRDEQKSVFGYLYSTSPAQAYAYAEATNNQINTIAEEEAVKKIQESATDNFWAGAGHTIGAIATAPLGLADYLNDIVMMSAGRPVTSDGFVSPFEYSQAVTGGITTHLNEESGVLDESIPIIGGKGLGDLYGLGTSIAQSMASAYTLGSTGTLISYFGQGAASGVDDALSRGATEEQSALYGTALGVFEGVAESIGIDNLFKLGSSTTIKGFIKNTLKQAGAEGTEEGLTAVLDNIADVFVMQDKSNFTIAINEYMANGMSESDAKWKVFWDSIEGIAFDTIAGAVSGGVSGGIHTTAQNIMENAEIKKHGQSIIDKGGVDPLMNLAYDMYGVEDSINAKEIENLTNKAKSKASAKNIGRLSAKIEETIDMQNASDIQNALTEKGLSKGEAKRVATYLMSNETLTAEQQAEVKDNEKIAEVVKELVNDPKSTLNQRKLNVLAARLGVDTKNSTINAKSTAVGDVSLKNDVDVSEKVSKEGKTIKVSTGEAITIDKNNAIAKTKVVDGERIVYYNTDHGVVEATDVTYASEEDGLLFEAFSDMNPAFANAVIKNYDSSVPVQTYIDGMREGIVLYGMHNFQAVGKDISRNSDLAELSEADQAFALKLGRAYAKTNVKKSDNALKTAIKNAAEKAEAEGKTSTTSNKKGGIRFENGARAKTVAQKRVVSLAKHLSRAIGIDIVFYDATKAGTKHSDSNGYFDPKDNSIHLDLQNAASDSKTIAFTLSHELVHFIKKWSPAKYKAFADFLMEQYAEHGVSTSTLLANKMAALGTTDADYAYEEMIADACERMLLDSNAVVKLMELRKSDLELFEKIKLHVLEILNKIRDAFKGIDPNTDEGIALQKMEDVLGKLHEMFEDAAVDAAKTYQEAQANAAELVFGESTVSEGEYDTSVKNQLKDSEKIGNASIAYNEKHRNVNAAVLKVGVDTMIEMAETMMPYLEQDGILPPDIPGKTIFKNGSYGRTGENTTLCVRTLTYEDFKDRVSDELGRPLTVAESLLVSQKIYDIATDPQCIYCYVAADRKAYDEYLGEYHKAMDKYIKAIRNGGNVEALYEEYLDGRKDTAAQQKRWAMWKSIANSGKDYISAKDLSTRANRDKVIATKGDLATQVKDAQRYAQSASWAKTVYDYRAYKGDILKLSKSLVDTLNSEYGLRMYSFSDYTPAFIVENMQMIIDASARGLKSLAYTKDTAYAKIFAPTGQAINVSCFAKYDSKTGTYVEDNRQGASWAETKQLRDKFHNVGAVMVCTNDAMVEWAMRQDWVDVVIPYHIVKTGTTIANEYAWRNYTAESSDRAGGRTANIYPTEHNNDFATYQKLIEERGIAPRFDRFYQRALNGDFTKEQYMKLVNEVRLPASELSAVVPMFDLAEAKKSFGVDEEGNVIEGGFVDKGGYMGGWYRTGVDVNQEVLAVKKDIEDGKSSLDVDYGMNKLLKEKQSDSYGIKKQLKKTSDEDYLDAVNRGDMETAQRMVDEAAKEAGYDSELLHHGTNKFGFTQIDVANSDDGISFFATNKFDTAASYIPYYEDSDAYDKIREIGKRTSKNRKILTANSSIEEFIDCLKDIYPDWYSDSHVITEEERNKYAGWDIADAVRHANELLRYSLPENVEELANLVIDSDGNKSRWKELAKEYKKFKDIPDITYRGNYFSEASHIWYSLQDNIRLLNLHLTQDLAMVRNVPESKESLLYAYEQLTGGENVGIYGLYAKQEGQLVIRGRASNWNNIPLGDITVKFNEWWVNEKGHEPAENGYYTRGNTRNIAEFAKAAGYRSVCFMDIYDTGAYGGGHGDLSTIYAFFYPEVDVKSADPVTYDDNGNVIPLSERFNSENNDIRYQKKHTTSYAPTFYSQMGKVIDDIKMEKIGTASIVNYLKGRGIKNDEIKWSGIEAFLEGKKSVTKADLQEFVAGSQLVIEEKMGEGGASITLERSRYGDDSWDVMRGGEILDTYSWNEDSELYESDETGGGFSTKDRVLEYFKEKYGSGDTRWGQYKLDGGANYRELVFKMPNSTYSNQAMRMHWGEDAEGVLVHARIQDFDVDGKKMLFIEEIQSDWHNEGHQRGYVKEDGKAYAHLEVIKENGRYSFVPKGTAKGSQESEADLRKRMGDTRVDMLRRQLINNDNAAAIPDAPFRNTYHEYVLKRLLRMATEEGYDSIGWTPAEIQVERWSEDYAEGYRIEYDQDIPSFLKKYGKKWGAKVGKTELPSYEPNATYYDVNRQEEYRSFTEWQNVVEQDLKAQGAPMRNLKYESDDNYWIAFDKVSGMEYDRAEIRKTSGMVWSMDITDSMRESVLYEGQPMFQKKTTTNRTLLANALESAAQNDIEKNKLALYKSKINLIESEQAKLAEVRAKANEIRFTKGRTPDETKQMKALDFEAKQIENRINTYDRQLLNLESTMALKNVLQREKQMAYKKAEQKGKEALAAYKEKSAQTQRELMNRYQESRKKGIESRNKTEMRHKIKTAVNDLNNYLLKGTKEKHVPIGLQKVVAEALDAVNMDTVGAEARITEKREEMRIAAANGNLDKVKQLAKEVDHIEEMGGNLNAKLERLKTAYDSIINSEDPLIANSHDEVISNTIAHVIEVIGDTSIRDMNLYQLEAVYKMYRMLLTSVRGANKAFKAAKSEEISTLANRIIEDLVNQKKLTPYSSKAMDTLNQLSWNNLKPIYAFERIGSSTFTDIYNNVRAGEDTWAKDMIEAQTFLEEQKKKYNYKSFDFGKQYEFTSANGHKFALNLEQIMSLYAYSKRGEQAKNHLRNGGFQFDKLTEVEVKDENGKHTKNYLLKDTTAYKISDMLLAEIIGVLDQVEGARGFADSMQEYLSSVMGEKGNETSLAMYDVKLFGEKNYFPLKVSEDFLARAREQAQGDVKIKNKGFTKALTDKAVKTIVLTPFMDVWSGHVNEMSMYHAFTLPLEDFYRVFNYSTPAVEGMDTVGVVSALSGAHREAAVQYIDQLLKDLNGGARSDPRESAGKKLMANFKKAAVMLSLSVVIQQPSAIVRATSLVNARYFAGKKATKGTVNAKWEVMKKYAPVVIIKDMGGFDTGMGKGSVDWLKGDKTFMDKVDYVTSWMPAKSDQATWVAIWNAVERETLHTHKNLQPNSEAFLKAVGERFTEVITKTQVYDSTLSRSANMRSKSLYMNMLTSFMAEPTTSINMLGDALRKGKKGDVKQMLKTMGAVYGAVLLNSALVSIVYAMRDDDEDETYLEKYLSRFTSEVVDGINPLTYIPFVKDIWSAAQGFDIERADMSLMTATLDSLQQLIKVVSKDTTEMDEEELAEHRKAINEGILSITDNLASLVGLPVKNVRRDFNGIINAIRTISKDATERDTTWGSLGDNIGEEAKNTIPVWGWLPDEKKEDKLYDAIIKGDDAYVERFENSYDSEKKYTNAIRKALRENDPRIKEAAQARIDGDISEYTRIVREIISEGNFVQDIVVGSVNAEINAINAKADEQDEATDEDGESEKATSIYRGSDINSAFESGDTSLAREIIDELIKTKVANGMEEKNAKSSVRSSMTSYWKPLYKAAYKAGNTEEMRRIRMILKASGIYGSTNDILDTCKAWLKEN